MTGGRARTRASRLPVIEVERDGAASLQSVRAGLVERLRARRSELEEAIFARFRETGYDPALGEDADYVAGARAAVAEAVDYGFMAIEHGEEWLSVIPPAAVAQARRAACNSVSLDRVLLRYNAGHALLEDFVMQEAERGHFAEHPMALRQVLRTQGALLDHFTSSIATEYQQEAERAAHSPELRRTERVQRLLAGAPVDTSELRYEFDAEHIGAIAMGEKAPQAVRVLAEELGCELLSVMRSEETVWAWFGSRRRLATADLQHAVLGRAPAGVSIALGAPGSAIEGWRLTHRQAQAAMLVALRKPQRLTLYADVALLAAVLSDRELARSLLDIHLSPLEDQKDGAVSRQTLRAYFAAGCNAATAAAALGVDRHTVERRLHTIETRLGHPLHSCHAELEVALRLEELGAGGPRSALHPG